MKKNKFAEVEVVEPDTVQQQEADKKSKDAAKTKKAKPKAEKKSLSKKMKEVSSELKKVSWPPFSKVAKATGVVIAVAIICTVALFGIDMLFKLMYDLLVK